MLAIIATIFIPLGFIAGLYGMNFDPAASPFNMPELGWRFGYPLALGLMAAVALACSAISAAKAGSAGAQPRRHGPPQMRDTADGPPD